MTSSAERNGGSQRAFAELDRDEGIYLEDDQAHRTCFDDIQRRGRERYEASRSES